MGFEKKYLSLMLIPTLAACGGGGGSDKSNSTPTGAKLSEVAKASAIVDGNNIKLNWDIPSDDKVKQIHINRKDGKLAPDTCEQSKGDAFARLDKNTQHTFTSLIPGKEYSFRICTSDGENVSTGITANLTALKVSIEDVSNLQANAGEGFINLSWDKPSADRYLSLKLAYAKDSEIPVGCSAGQSLKLAHNIQEYKLDNLEGNVSYNIRLCSLGAGDIASSGKTAQATTLPIPPDQDKDGVIDSIDVDDDNDGLIEISSVEMLNNIRNNLNGTGYHDGTENKSDGCVASGCNGYELTKSLDFSGTKYAEGGDLNGGWQPIGNKYPSNMFDGIFEGNNFKISNLYINRSEHALGLFGFSRNANIRNLTLDAVNINGFIDPNDSAIRARYVGGVVGYIASPNQGSISGFTQIKNVSVNGKVASQTGAAGALIGEVRPSYYLFEFCSKTPCSDTEIFKPSVTIAFSHSAGSVESTRAGGLVGIMAGGSIISSYSKANVKGRSSGIVGGLVGEFKVGQSKNINGQMSLPGNVILSSFALGEVSDGHTVGGIVGSQAAKTKIISSYSANPKVNASSTAAGLVAQWRLQSGTADMKPTIINSLTRSSQVSGGSFHHGLVSKNSGTGIPAQIVNSHWDRNTTRDGVVQSGSNNVYVVRSIGGSGYTSNQLKGNEAVTAETPGFLPGPLHRNNTTTDSPFRNWLPVSGQHYSSDQKLMLYCDDNADGMIQDSETTAIWDMRSNNDYPVINCVAKDIQM
ncbi:fibronectin type III domain-containing protein [Parashewanella tropica]|uniref:fibronectin type III domain-containing protein n=1 Tax=Parashewanella tropica TaxID=2547970 RepID=UPI001059B4BD|nr:fibronectin type III domain-containing protein [Parashewanella tropica]